VLQFPRPIGFGNPANIFLEEEGTVVEYSILNSTERGPIYLGKIQRYGMKEILFAVVRHCVKNVVKMWVPEFMYQRQLARIAKYSVGN